MTENEDVLRLKEKIIAHLGSPQAWELWLDIPDTKWEGTPTHRQLIEQGYYKELEAWIDNITGPSPGYG